MPSVNTGSGRTRPACARVIFVLIIEMGFGLLAASAAGQETKAMLLLQTYGQNTPGRLVFDGAVTRTLYASADPKIDIYLETIDAARFDNAQVERTRAYLRERYADKRISVVIAAYDRALTFLLDPRAPLFPESRIAALISRRPDPESLPDRVAAIWEGTTYADTVGLALRLQPQTRRIVLIDAVAPGIASDAIRVEALHQIEGAAQGRGVVTLFDLPLDQLLARVQTLPSDAIIVVARQVIGIRGEATSTVEAIKALAPAARVPLFVISDLQMGSGAVGGMVPGVDSEAARLGELALRLARDESARPALGRIVTTPIVDWRALQRWQIDESRVPPGGEIRYRQLTAWMQYRRYILGAAIVVGLQSLLIAGLVVQRARRRRTELALRESERSFRDVAEKNQDLAGRLIRAQEEERTRIARDLHDDVSQQLAGVGIMLGVLKRKMSEPGSRPAIDQTLGTLLERNNALAESVRNISHQLHPDVLKHVGLVPTLRRHCADMERDHHAAVAFSASGDFESLSPDVALCLFRVAQEALTNAAKHARAGTVLVQLRASSGGTEMQIVDDGVGFAVGERTRGGLGLRSIDERVRLVHGTVTLESQPGEGTRLLVRIPHPEERSRSVVA